LSLACALNEYLGYSVARFGTRRAGREFEDFALIEGVYEFDGVRWSRGLPLLRVRRAHWRGHRNRDRRDFGRLSGSNRRRGYRGWRFRVRWRVHAQEPREDQHQTRSHR
jgi:hypothetical protein